MKAEHDFNIGKLNIHCCVSYICNLSCKGCNFGAPLNTDVDPPFISIEEFARDLKKITGLFSDFGICIFGGEPLLHPDIVQLMYTARSICPTQQVGMLTNGTLLGQMPEEFFEASRKTTIGIIIQDYGSLNEQEIVDICEGNNIPYYYQRIEVFGKSLNDKKIHDKGFGYSHCPMKGDTIVYRGYLYSCNIAVLAEKLKQAYGILEDYDPKTDRVLLCGNYSEDMIRKIRAKIKVPRNVCAYCGGYSAVFKSFNCMQKEPELSDYIVGCEGE